MAVDMTPAELLRMRLGESYPEGGSASDTLFTDAEIETIIKMAPSSGRAAFEGWRVKAAKLSTLVDTTEGNTSRKFSQSLANAEKMMRQWSRSGDGATEGRARVGRIRRSDDQWY